MSKRLLLVSTLSERYKCLKSYRAVAAELDNAISPATVRNVVLFSVWSPKAARALGIEPTRTRFAADISPDLLAEIRAECIALEVGNGELLRLMWDLWIAWDDIEE